VTVGCGVCTTVGDEVGLFVGCVVGPHSSCAVNVAKVPREVVLRSELAARLDANCL
jgi:hypothetical protein